VTGCVERAEVDRSCAHGWKEPGACQELKEEQAAEVETQSFFRQKQARLLALVRLSL